MAVLSIRVVGWRKFVETELLPDLLGGDWDQRGFQATRLLQALDDVAPAINEGSGALLMTMVAYSE